MFGKLAAIFGFRTQPKIDPDVAEILNRFMQKVAAEATTQQSPEQLSPRDAQLCFECVQNLLCDLAVRNYSAFDLDILRTNDPEAYWGLVEYGVVIAKLNRPVRAEWFREVVKEYTLAFEKSFASMQRQTLGGE
jgi:hypothetical protein